MPVFSHGFGIVCACAWSSFIVFRMLLLFTAVVLGHHRHCRRCDRCRHHHCCRRRRHCCHHHHHFQPTTTANPPPPMTSPSIDHKIPFYKNHYHIPLHGHPPKLKIPQYYVLPHLPNSPTEDPVKAGKFLKSTSCKPNIFPNPESPIQI